MSSMRYANDPLLISRYERLQSGSIVQTLDHTYVIICFSFRSLLYSYGLAIIINAKRNIQVNTFDVNRLIKTPGFQDLSMYNA